MPLTEQNRRSQQFSLTSALWVYKQPKKFGDEELEALLDKDCCQTQKELAESLGVTQAAISKRLKAAGYIQKQGN